MPLYVLAKDPPPPDSDPTPDRESRKSALPLVWLLALIAVGAAIWYFTNRSDPAAPPSGPATPIADPATPGPAEDPAGSAAGDSPAPSPHAARPAQADRAPPRPAPRDRDARPLDQVTPEYPAAALRSREQGTVLLRVEVDARGNPASVEVERSSRSRELDRAARRAVRRWTFQPAIEDGRPVASTVTVPVDFRIGEQ